MSAAGSKARPRQRALRAASLAPIVVAPHLLAGATTELSAILAILVAISATATLFTLDDARFPVGTRGLVALLTTLVVVSALQAVPLPCGFVESWLGLARVSAPYAVAHLTETSPYCAISVDPGNTLVALMQGATCLAVFAICALHCAAGGRRDIMRAVALAGLTIAVASLLHLLYDADRVYGVYAPRDLSGKPFGPIINTNHLAGLCALTMPTMVGLGLEHEDRSARLTWLGAAIVTFVVGLMTLSRGGIAALVLGAVLCVLVVRRRKSRLSPRTTRGVALTLAIGGLLGWFLFGDRIMHEFLVGDASKIDLIVSGMNHALRQGLTGHGRGAFGVAAIDVSGSGDWAYYAESMPVQWIGDYGVLLGPIALVALATSVLSALLARDRVQRQLVAAGLFVFGLQNLVDFGVEMTGIGIVASAALAAATARRTPSTTASERSITTPRALVISAVVLALALAITRSGTSLERDMRALRDSLVAQDFVDFDARVASALRMHPRNPALALYAAAAARVRDRDETVPWLNLAMRSASAWWSPHQEAARFFQQRRRFLQAAHEAKIVADTSRDHGLQLACELAHRGMPARHLARIAPSTAPGAFLARVVTCAPAPTAASLHDTLMTWRKPPVASFTRAFSAAVAARDPEALDALVRRGRGLHPRSATFALEAARALGTIGRHAEAHAELRRARGLGAPPAETSLVEATTYAAQRDVARMRRALAAYRDAQPSDLDVLARAEVTTAQLELHAGSPSAAIRAYERAFELNGDASHLAAIVVIAEQSRFGARGLVARRQLCAQEPTHTLCRDVD